MIDREHVFGLRNEAERDVGGGYCGGGGGLRGLVLGTGALGSG